MINFRFRLAVHWSDHLGHCSMGFLSSTWWLVYLLLLQSRAVARDLAGHMLSFSSSLSSLMLLGLYSSHMLSGTSSATSIFQFSCLVLSFLVVWIYAWRKEYDILHNTINMLVTLDGVVLCWYSFCMFKWMEYRAK